MPEAPPRPPAPETISLTVARSTIWGHAIPSRMRRNQTMVRKGIPLRTLSIMVVRQSRQ